MYPNKESSLIINTTSFKKCSGQAGLPGSLPPCAETLAGEDAMAHACERFGPQTAWCAVVAVLHWIRGSDPSFYVGSLVKPKQRREGDIQIMNLWSDMQWRLTGMRECRGLPTASGYSRPPLHAKHGVHFDGGWGVTVHRPIQVCMYGLGLGVLAINENETLGC